MSPPEGADGMRWRASWPTSKGSTCICHLAGLIHAFRPVGEPLLPRWRFRFAGNLPSGSEPRVDGDDDSITLGPAPVSAALARRFVADRIDGPRRNDVLLVVSELVTNALMHTEGVVRVTVHREAAAVTVEVWDSSPEVVPHAVTLPASRPGGRGLHIVAAIADEWGYRPDPPGKAGGRC